MATQWLLRDPPNPCDCDILVLYNHSHFGSLATSADPEVMMVLGQWNQVSGYRLCRPVTRHPENPQGQWQPIVILSRGYRLMDVV